jgi:HEPN domain-containing protein
MNNQDWTLRRFKQAGQAHLHSASRILKSADGNNTGPALTSVSATYLAHVALECLLKANLLRRGGFENVAKLRKSLPRVYENLFRGVAGHSIKQLADELRLHHVLVGQDDSLTNDACWARVCSSERPYSLRYGAEELTVKEATEDVNRAEQIARTLLRDLGRKRSGDRA